MYLIGQIVYFLIAQPDRFHDIIRKDRTRQGGRSSYLCKKDLSFKKRLDLDLDIESISIELGNKYVKSIIISTLYRPPDSLVELFDLIEKLVSNIDQENNKCIIAGDFNCDLLKTGDNNPKHIKRIYRAYSSKQLIETPTRTTSDSKTLVDHVATNRPEWVF